MHVSNFQRRHWEYQHMYKILEIIHWFPTPLSTVQGSVYGVTLARCTCITSLQWLMASCSSPAPSTGRWQQCRTTWRTSWSLKSQTWSNPLSRSSTGYGHTMTQLVNSSQRTNNLITLQLEPMTNQPRQILSLSLWTFEVEGMCVKSFQSAWPVNVSIIFYYMRKCC